MEYRAGHLTISSEDVARLLGAAWRSLRRWSTTLRPTFTARPAMQGYPSDHAAMLELTTAQALFAQGHLRAAGALAGVALELHLQHVAAAHRISIAGQMGIGPLHEALRTAGVLAPHHPAMIRQVSKIRNRCIHARNRVPSQGSVERALIDVELLLREVRP